MPINSDQQFSRLILQGTLAEVLKVLSRAETRRAWVWTSDRRTWEFHYRDFFFCTGASNAYEARARGWDGWLKAQKHLKSEKQMERSKTDNGNHDKETT